MGFLGDLESGLSYLSPGTALLKSAIDRSGNAANPIPQGPRLNYQNDSAGYKNNQNNYGLGTDIASPQDYTAMINNAFVNLGQPADAPDRQDITNNFIRSLSSSFVDRYHTQTGRVPTADQVKQFVSQNASGANASRFIQDQLNPDKINTISDQYLQGNPNVTADPNAQSAEQQRILSLNDQLDKAYKAGSENYVNSYDQNIYNPNKARTTNDLAGQGMLTNPNSRYSLDQIDANRGRDLSSGLNTLASNRAAGSVDLGKTIEGLLQSQQGINNQSSQFNRTFNANQDQNYFNQGLQNRALSMGQQIGQLQAAGQSNNGLSGGLGGGIGGAAAGSAFGPWGAGIGGLAGLLGGYFGTKK